MNKHHRILLSNFVHIAIENIPNNPAFMVAESAVRVTNEVLEKLHFKAIPLAVEATIMKISDPSEPDDFAFMLYNHLISLVNGEYLIDLSLNQVERPHREMPIIPIIASINANNFLAGEDITVNNGNFIIKYKYLNNEDYKKNKHFFDKKRWDKLISVIHYETKQLVKEQNEVRNTKRK